MSLCFWMIVADAYVMSFLYLKIVARRAALGASTEIIVSKLNTEFLQYYSI